MDEAADESEWMWVQVDSCDDEAGLLFGRLDSEPQEVLHSVRALRRHRS